MPVATADEIVGIACPIKRAAAITEIARGRCTLPAPLAYLRRLALAECRFVLGMSATSIKEQTGTPRARVFTLTRGLRPTATADTSGEQAKHNPDGSPDTMPDILATMTVRQAGVINRVHGEPGHRMTVNDLQHSIPVGNDTIETLSGNGFVALRDPIGSRTVRISNAFTIGVTAKGCRWHATDPLNRLLNDAVSAPNRRLRLNSHAARHYERYLITGAVDRGLLTLHYAGDGRETQFGADTDYVFRNGGDFDLRPTRDADRWTGAL